MTRARPPVWLSGPGRFAGLRPVQALVVAIVALMLLALAIVMPGDDTGTAAIAGPGDLSLYGAIVEGVRAGGDYYSVTAQALRTGGYPLKPFMTFRLPTLAVVQAALPDLLTILLLFGTAAATALAWARRIAGWFVRPAARMTALFLLGGGMVAFVQPGLIHFHEIWAGLLIAWSLAIRRDDRWIEAVAIGLCAMLLRETAALYPLAMLGAAAIDGRRREALGWATALAIFVAVLSLHARAAGLSAGPLDPVSPGWDGLHGPGMFAGAMAQSTVLALLPWWIGAPVAMAAMVGWAAAPGPLGLRAALVFGGYALAMAVFARADNFYWVLAAAPAFLVGLAFLPDASRDLARGLLDRRRVRVQRITR